MLMQPGDAFFSDLQAQVEEDVIVEDEETLARIALLVPMLMDVLRRVDPQNPEAAAALAVAEETIRKANEI